MKGLGYLGNKKVGFVEKPEPKIQNPTEALIRVTATAVCTSDVHFAEHDMTRPIGKIMGHEAVGIVTEVGDLVRHVKPGDRVVAPEIIPVLDSDEGMDGIGNWATDPVPSRRTATGMQGMLTTHLLYPRADTGLAVIPDNITDEQALMLTDMIPTAAAGINYMDIQLGETVVVIGIGPVGLMGVELAKLRGAARIIGIGSRRICMETAKDLGATDLLNYHDGPLSGQVLALNGAPVDKVLIAGGNSDTITEAFAMCKPGGKIANVAAFFESAPQNAETITMSWDKEYRSLWEYSDRLQLKRWMKLIGYGKLHPERLVTHVLHGLDSLPEAYELTEKKGEGMIKAIVLL